MVELSHASSTAAATRNHACFASSAASFQSSHAEAFVFVGGCENTSSQEEREHELLELDISSFEYSCLVQCAECSADLLAFSIATPSHRLADFSPPCCLPTSTNASAASTADYFSVNRTVATGSAFSQQL